MSNRKPPAHPNHHQCNYNNHKLLSISTTTPSITNTQTIPVVHNANNRLPNNTIFHNNQYKFSLDHQILNRNGGDGGGYLDPRPLSAASLYGDGQRVVRGTKSDVGVPCRRQSTTAAAKSMLHQHNHGGSGTGSHTKSKLPSVKSDFLLSYLNNNSKTHEMHNTSAYFISDGATATTTTMTPMPSASDYIEPYRSDNSKRRLYSSSSKLEHIDLHANRTAKYQRERTHNFGRHTNAITNENSNNVGPLLYLDSFEQFNNDKSAFSNAQYQSMQSVSKTYNA